jgi:hypothetical protein
VTDSKERLRRGRSAIGEFLIIVVGVLVALGFESWRERARERDLEAEYAGRLIEDLDRLQGSLTRVIDAAGALDVAAAVALPFLETGETAREHAVVLTALYQATRLVIPDMTPIVYEELLATGRLGLIEDAQIRSQLGEYFTDLARLGDFLALRPLGYTESARKVLPLSLQLGVRSRCDLVLDDRGIDGCAPNGLDPAVAARSLEDVRAVDGLAGELRFAIHNAHALAQGFAGNRDANRELRSLLELAYPAVANE